mmetsp:Transcript_46455/g.91420  ORF Transcript_46455/g.91420 Transcript_46455/m.91420 type:complete len:89 (-) Transcript_46455:62-328(-)
MATKIRRFLLTDSVTMVSVGVGTVKGSDIAEEEEEEEEVSVAEVTMEANPVLNRKAELKEATSVKNEFGQSSVPPILATGTPSQIANT